MELGLHCYDTSKPATSYEDKRLERLSTLLSSIFILDRQWSASAGLPNQFVETSFDITSVLPVSLDDNSIFGYAALILSIASVPLPQCNDGILYDQRQIR